MTKIFKLQSYQNLVSSLIISGSGFLVLVILKFLCHPDISASYLVQYSFAGLMILLDFGFGLNAQRLLSRESQPGDKLAVVSHNFAHQYLIKLTIFISFFYFILNDISSMQVCAMILGSLLPIAYFIQCILKGSEQYDKLRTFNLKFAIVNVGSVSLLVIGLNVEKVLYIQAFTLLVLLLYTSLQSGLMTFKKCGSDSSGISHSQNFLLAPQLFSGILSVHGMRLVVENLYGSEMLVNFSLIYSVCARFFQVCVSMYEPILNNLKRLNATQSVFDFGFSGLIRPIIIFAVSNLFLVIVYLIVLGRDVWVTIYLLYFIGMILNLATSPILLLFNYEGKLKVVFIATLGMPILYFGSLYLMHYFDETIITVGLAYLFASLIYSITVSVIYVRNKYAK